MSLACNSHLANGDPNPDMDSGALCTSYMLSTVNIQNEVRVLPETMQNIFECDEAPDVDFRTPSLYYISNWS